MTFNEFVHTVPVKVLESFQLKPEQIHQVCEGYWDGKTVIQLGKEFNVSKTTIRRILNSCNIERKRKDNKFTEKEVSEEIKQIVINAFINKKLITEIQAETGLSYYIIRAILHQADLKRWRKLETQPSKKSLLPKVIPPKAKHPWGFYRVRNDWKKGNVTIYDLAKIHNLTIDTIKWWLIKDGYGVITMANKAVLVHDPEIIAKGVPAGEFRRLCREATPELIQRLLERAMEDEIGTKELKEITEFIVERGYGKPKMMDEEEEHVQTAKERILKSLPNNTTAKILNLKKDKE